jgi:SAM-dependent methyltransferase
MEDAAFYSTTQMYIWNHTLAEEKRIENGDFQRMYTLLSEGLHTEDLSNFNILDFGAGIGSAGLYLWDRGVAESMEFCEVNYSTRKFLKARLANRNLDHRKYLIHESLNAFWIREHGGVRDISFDLVIAYAVFEHMANPVLQHALMNLKRLLRPSGTLFMVNYHDTFDGEYPMHYEMNRTREALFRAFAKERKLIEGNWEYMEGKVSKNVDSYSQGG